MKNSILGTIGTWLCDHCYPRPATTSECAQSQQYCQLMIDVLRGEVPYYGRDRGKDATPFVSERRDYEAIYGRK
jgi:hypothetical protein